jgi:hypothetical protein
MSASDPLLTSRMAACRHAPGGEVSVLSVPRSPTTPDLTGDPAYAAEAGRRLQIVAAPPNVLNHLITTPIPRAAPRAPLPAGGAP